MEELLCASRMIRLVDHVTASFAAFDLVVAQIDKKARLHQLKEDSLVYHYLRDVLSFISDDILKGDKDKIKRTFSDVMTELNPLK